MKDCTQITRSKSKHLSALKVTHAGIDIGAGENYVCIATSSSDQMIRSFSTFTCDLKQMVQWFKENGITSVAMESTGVYWIPLFELLEENHIEVLLVNARHLKNVPGRKTDVLDCQWIQELHSYGLLRGSFRPDNDYVELRSYVRLRSRLYESAATQVQLMHKALVLMNLQINHVISDITGSTGMQIIRSILSGERDPKKLASFRDIRCKRSEEDIAKSLEGNYRKEHVFALQKAYDGYEFFHKQITDCEQEILTILHCLQKTNATEESLIPSSRKSKKTAYNRSPYHFDAGLELNTLLKVDLTEIPGVDANTIMKVISETGTDMSRWKNAKHFCSWLGLCPGNKISGGKILSSKTKPTQNRAARALRLSANALYHSPSSLGAFFRRMRAKFGAPKAITAAAHKLARLLYRLLRNPQKYQELGEDYYEQKYKDRMLKNLRRRAKEFGYNLTPVNS